MKVSIREAADMLGMSQESLRRWETAGKIKAERTAGGHRRYDLVQLRQVMAQLSQPTQRTTIAYARVATLDAHDLLERQRALLDAFCTAHGWEYELICDFGSGVTAEKPGLHQLIQRIGAREVERLVVAHRNRLLRFSPDLLMVLCATLNTEVVVVSPTVDYADAADLAQDAAEAQTILAAHRASLGTLADSHLPHLLTTETS